jgi:hypothetical protein
MCLGKLNKLAGIVSKSAVKRIISSLLLKVKEHSLKLAVKCWSEGIVHGGKFVMNLSRTIWDISISLSHEATRRTLHPRPLEDSYLIPRHHVLMDLY